MHPPSPEQSQADTVQPSFTRESLQASLITLQQVIDRLPQAVAWRDTNSTFLGCNRSFANAVGLGHPAEIVGKAVKEVQWATGEANFLQSREQALIVENRAEYHLLESSQQADGQQIWLDVSQIPLEDDQGKVVGIVSVIEDITQKQQTQAEKASQDRPNDRNQREAALRQSEAKFQELTEELETRVEARTLELLTINGATSRDCRTSASRNRSARERSPVTGVGR
ncbi:MAG: PAS domain-containing protein [Kovacikia sp.]